MKKPKRVVVLNDTRRDVGHVGCEMVMQNLLSLLRESGAEVVATFEDLSGDNHMQYRTAIALSDAVVVNGEGTMHHDRPMAIDLVAAAEYARSLGKQSFLINSVWQDNPFLDHRLPGAFDAVFVRESRSAAQVSVAGVSARVVPDLSFFGMSSHRSDNRRTRKPTYTDSVRPGVTRLLRQAARIHGGRHVYMRPPAVEVLRQHFPGAPRWLAATLASSAMGIKDFNGPIVSGRYHAVCIAMKFGLPFLAVSSNTHKLEGMLDDVGGGVSQQVLSPGGLVPETVVQRASALDGWTPEFSDAVEAYVQDARRKIAKMVSEVAQS